MKLFWIFLEYFDQKNIYIYKVGGAKSFASHCALIERYEMVPRKELLFHENHLHFNFLPMVGIREHKNSST